MKTIRYISVYVLLFCCMITSSAQQNETQYYFKNLDIKDGLSQNTVNAILQDKKGFMWFGTKDGLNRYDGLSFRVFKRKINDKTTLGNNFITYLYEDINGCMWVGTDAGLYIYNPQEESFEHFSVKTDDGVKIDGSVTMIKGTEDGVVWIAVERQGLFCYNLNNNEFTYFVLNGIQGITTNIECFQIDNTGTIWIGFYGDGLFYSKDSLKTLCPFMASNGQETFESDIVSKIIQGAYNCLYVASVKEGLIEINQTSGNIRTLLSTDEAGEDIYIRDFIPYSENELWLGTESGIYIYNLRTNDYTHHKSLMNDPYSLSDNAVYSLWKDKEGGVWIGSYFGGVNYFPKQYSYFEKYYPRNDGNSLHGKRVREFCQDDNGFIWIGTEDGGLTKFDPVNKRYYFFEPSKSFTNVHGLCIDGNDLWVGTFSKGLKKVDRRTGKVIKTYTKGNTPGSLSDNSVFAICKTMSGDIYAGTLFGLYLYDRLQDNFIPVPQLNGKFIYDIKEDSHGNLWLATYANGAYRYDINKKEWMNYRYDENDENSIPYNKVLSIFEDSHRQIWLTTQGGGFCKFNPKTETFVRYGAKEGFPNDVVYQIIEDDADCFWLTTNAGLVKFNTQDKTIKVFTTANGLPVNQFNYRSGLKTSNGKIYLGSINGFIVFDPKEFTENNYIPPVTITDFLLFNKKVPVMEKGSPLKKSITFSDTIVLAANQNSFSLRIAGLSYQAPQMNRLMYKLDGFDDDWLLVTESPLVTYANLKHGKYVFRVKASNSDGIWNPEEAILHIEILPPFYLTIWAYCFYVLFFVAFTCYMIFYFKKKQSRRHLRQMEKFEQEKEREIYNAKIDFFTNVAHEIRTPLTLIKGPLENILLKKNVDEETREDLTIMGQNTERLLTLTNQLLDFRKTEKQGFRLNFIECNVADLVRETYQRFTSLAKQKGLILTLELSQENLYAHVDKEAFIKIISNLFNNAVKYAATYIHVMLSMDESKDIPVFIINVVNDGIIIPEEMREEIFKPFVRFNGNGIEMSNGTGIGLALSRSLAELHSGSLGMGDTDKSNSFILMMPMAQSHTIHFKSEDSLPAVSNTDASSEISDSPSSKPSVLVVEDNPEMRAFVMKQLQHFYTVYAAENGVKAIEILDNNYINLIVSDVVMPLMDGFELCKIVKSELNYSHIPIVLLTAKTNMQSKIEGLELGADAYIEKPFSVEYLQANIANLIQNREKLRQTFTRSPFVAANTMAMTKADEEFLKKLNEIIHENLHNPDFSMDDMADILHMSRSSFYRKIKGVLDLSPNDYLRLERLKKAAQLLKEGNNRVNEICYMVGFNSPSYFAKCFQKQFGVLPKDFAE